MRNAAASLIAERINIGIINGYAMRRARIGEGQGERATPGAARPAMQLVEIREGGASGVEDGPRGAKIAQGEAIDITRPGFRASRRRLPAVLSRMDEADARRVAAGMYAAASEKIGAVAGASAEGVKADGGAGTNDGGVTTRIRHAATINTVEAALGEVGPVLVPKARGGGNRRAITARELMDAVCLEGSDMKAILTAAGWSGHRRDVAALGFKAELCLELMARRLGLISRAAPLPASALDAKL